MVVDYSLYYVTGRHLLPPGLDFLEHLEAALRGGVTLVQLREKTIPTREYLTLAEKALDVCNRYSVPLIINDRLDVALALPGVGLHVGQDDLPFLVARKLLGPDRLLGVSINTAEEMNEVLEAGEGVVDYVGIGPAYTTKTKLDLNPIMGVRGIAKILEIMGDSSIKAVAISGINEDTAPNVLSQAIASSSASGRYRHLDGLAVVSVLAASPTPTEPASRLSRLIKSTRPRPPLPLGLSVIILQQIADLLSKLRDGASPLVHSITNSVVMNQCANVTLAFSGSPIMTSAPQEMSSLGKISSALVANLGTLSAESVESMILAGKGVRKRAKNVIMDPVGCGATTFRKAAVDRKGLMNEVHVTIIKGNAGEVGALLGSSEVLSRGVDSVGAGFENPGLVVRQLARREKTVVAMSGVVDYVSDGVNTFGIKNGHIYQGAITGSGCMATTVVATFAAVADTPLLGALAGLVAYNVAAEIAAERDDVRGPHTFRDALLDECWNLKGEDIMKRGRIEKLDVS